MTIQEKILEHQRQIAELVGQEIKEAVAAAEKSGALKTIKGKQELAKQLNALWRSSGVKILHPETQAPCCIIAINDARQGLFCYERSDGSRKRLGTTTNIRDLMPFTVIPMLEQSRTPKQASASECSVEHADTRCAPFVVDAGARHELACPDYATSSYGCGEPPVEALTQVTDVAVQGLRPVKSPALLS